MRQKYQIHFYKYYVMYIYKYIYLNLFYISILYENNLRVLCRTAGMGVIINFFQNVLIQLYIYIIIYFAKYNTTHQFLATVDCFKQKMTTKTILLRGVVSPNWLKIYHY